MTYRPADTLYAMQPPWEYALGVAPEPLGAEKIRLIAQAGKLDLDRRGRPIKLFQCVRLCLLRETNI
jgi:hypothetical protein